MTKIVFKNKNTPYLLGSYKNGNYETKIYSDGTRIRETEDNKFIPSFAENIDIKITNKCHIGCSFCHEGSTSEGKHGDILNPVFINSFKPWQEIAIGGGGVFEHPDLIKFLKILKEQKVIANITVHQIDYIKHFETIKSLISDKLVYGVGVSVMLPSIELIEKLKEIPSVVCHVINGIFDNKTYELLKNNNLKLLILGYKELRRGNEYLESASDIVKENQEWLFKNLETLLKEFRLISFDNLALEQLNVKRLLTKEEWEVFYQGDDGSSTFYIDAIEQKFAQSSTAPFNERYDIKNLTVENMFKIINTEYKKDKK